jgi:hypothetical protein
MKRREVLKSGMVILASQSIGWTTENNNFLHSVKILKADVANSNKRIYARKAIENAIETIPELGRYCIDGYECFDVKINLSDVSHRVSNPIIDKDGYLVVDIEVLDTPKGILLKNKLMTGDVVFRTCSLCSDSQVSEDIVQNGETVIVDFTIISVDAISSEIASNLD